MEHSRCARSSPCRTTRTDKHKHGSATQPELGPQGMSRKGEGPLALERRYTLKLETLQDLFKELCTKAQLFADQTGLSVGILATGECKIDTLDASEPAPSPTTLDDNTFIKTHVLQRTGEAVKIAVLNYGSGGVCKALVDSERVMEQLAAVVAEEIGNKDEAGADPGRVEAVQNVDSEKAVLPSASEGGSMSDYSCRYELDGEGSRRKRAQGKQTANEATVLEAVSSIRGRVQQQQQQQEQQQQQQQQQLKEQGPCPTVVLAGLPIITPCPDSESVRPISARLVPIPISVPVPIPVSVPISINAPVTQMPPPTGAAPSCLVPNQESNISDSAVHEALAVMKSAVGVSVDTPRRVSITRAPGPAGSPIIRPMFKPRRKQDLKQRLKAMNMASKPVTSQTNTSSTATVPSGDSNSVREACPSPVQAVSPDMVQSQGQGQCKEGQAFSLQMEERRRINNLRNRISMLQKYTRAGSRTYTPSGGIRTSSPLLRSSSSTNLLTQAQQAQGRIAQGRQAHDIIAQAQHAHPAHDRIAKAQQAQDIIAHVQQARDLITSAQQAQQAHDRMAEAQQVQRVQQAQDLIAHAQQAQQAQDLIAHAQQIQQVQQAHDRMAQAQQAQDRENFSRAMAIAKQRSSSGELQIVSVVSPSYGQQAMPSVHSQSPSLADMQIMQRQAGSSLSQRQQASHHCPIQRSRQDATMIQPLFDTHAMSPHVVIESPQQQQLQQQQQQLQQQQQQHQPLMVVGPPAPGQPGASYYMLVPSQDARNYAIQPQGLHQQTTTTYLVPQHATMEAPKLEGRKNALKRKLGTLQKQSMAQGQMVVSSHMQ